MSNSYLLSGKFASANLSEVCAPRRALVDLFQKASDKRIIYVCAPAGYGKTTSAQLWLQDSGRTSLWIALDEYDNTPSIFYKLICVGILSLQPENKAMADIVASPSFAYSPVEHTIRLLSEFIPDERRYAIVLDDMHLVLNKEIRKSGLLVEKRLPSSFVTVILTRNNVAQEYIDITGKEKYTIITSKDLAFSAEEIQQYFNEYNRSISLEEAQLVHAATNGWPICINAMAVSGQSELRQKHCCILSSYIKTHIWDKWDEDLREFMLKTSPVDEMPTELCCLITQRADSRDILEKLCGDNAFVRKISDDLYKYHDLFCEFLREQATLESTDFKEIYQKAARYYVDQNNYFMARRYATKAGDIDILIDLLHCFSQYRSANLDEFVNFSRLYENDAPSESVCDVAPFLYASLMWENYLLGNAAKMEYFMDKIYHFLPEIATKFPQYMETIFMLITLDHRVSLSAQLDRLCTLPPIELLHEAQQGATLTHEMPFLHRSNRDYYELADDSLREKLVDSCAQLFKGSMDIFLAGLESGLLLEKNLIREAMDAAIRTKNMENEHISDEIHFAVSLHLCEAYYAAGDPKWKKVLKETETFIAAKGALYLTPNFMAYKTRLLLSNADKHAAMEWFKNYFVTDTEHLELYKIYQHFTSARAYIVLSQMDKALDYILKLKKLGADFNRPTDIAEASALQVVAEWALGNKKQAIETLEAALAAAQNYGFIRSFANEGASILPVLRRLQQKVAKAGYSGPLNAQFLNRVTIAAYELSKRCKGIAANVRIAESVRLSKQQKHILTLLAQGYKNAEIVEITGLTIHTVKSHCASAYAKLGAHSAMDAVIAAKELKLI